MRLTPPMRTGSNSLCALAILTATGCTLSGNVAERVVGCTTIPQDSGGIFNVGALTVKNSSSITGNSYSGDLADVVNAGVLYLDGSSTIGVLGGNAAVLI